MQHMRNVPVQAGLPVPEQLIAAQLQHCAFVRMHADGGADISIVTRAAVERMWAHLPPRERPALETSAVKRVRGVAGAQDVLGEIKLTFTVYYSVCHLPFESRTFTASFHVVETLPGGLEGLIGKELCQPGHPFFDHIYRVHAERIQFFSDTHLPPSAVTVSRESSREVGMEGEADDAAPRVLLAQRLSARERDDTQRRHLKEEADRAWEQLTPTQLTRNSFPSPTLPSVDTLVDAPDGPTGESHAERQARLRGIPHAPAPVVAFVAPDRLARAVAAAVRRARSESATPAASGEGGGPQPGHNEEPEPLVGAQLSGRQAPLSLASPIIAGHLITAPLLHRIATAQHASSEQQRATWGPSEGFKTLDVNGVAVVVRYNRIVVPTETLQQELLATHHVANLHQGAGPMVASLQRVAWWPTLQEDCRQRVAQCPECQYGRIRSSLPRIGKLHPTLCGTPLSTWYVDAQGPFPASTMADGRAATYLMVAIDAFTRVVFMKAYPTVRASTATEFAAALVARYCLPRIVRTDGAPTFKNVEFRTWCEKRRIDLIIGVAEHHRGQGLVERALGGILTTLKTVTFPRPATWAHAGRLEALQASINETPHGSLGMSPFAALHGFEPRTSTSSSLGLEEPLFESISQYHEVILAAQERARDEAENKLLLKAIATGNMGLLALDLQQ